MTIQEGLQNVLASLPSYVTLVAVSKMHPPEKIMEAYDAGQRDFGENRVQELTKKAGVMPKDIRWHLIGHLQTNKVHLVAPFVHLIHSVDSERLLSEINKQGEKNKRVISCLIQIHIAEEESKYGLATEEAKSLLVSEKIKKYPFVRICGLMGMATLTRDKTIVKSEFRKLKRLFDELCTGRAHVLNILSMGMSGDADIAVMEGSNMVRIGTAIFRPDVI